MSILVKNSRMHHFWVYIKESTKRQLGRATFCCTRGQMSYQRIKYNAFSYEL